MIQFDTLRMRFRNMDNRELRQEIKMIRSLNNSSPLDTLAQELITEELELRDREYVDWISKEVV